MTGRLPMRHGLLRPRWPASEAASRARSRWHSCCQGQAIGRSAWANGTWREPAVTAAERRLRRVLRLPDVANIYTEWRDPYFNPDIATKPGRQAFVKGIPFSKDLVRAKKGGRSKSARNRHRDDAATRRVACRVLDRIPEVAQGARQPFFLYHATTGVHFDNYPSEQWQGQSPAGYPVKDVMVQLDDIAGRLVRTLQETGNSRTRWCS